MENEKLVIDPQIKISNSKFEGNVCFERVFFKNPVEIQNTIFCKNAFFAESKFNGYARFSGSHFEGYTYFGRSEFNGWAYFDKSYFCQYVDFGKSLFKANAYFRGTHFEGEVIFGESQFNNVLSFRDATFGDATFKDPKNQEEVCRMVKTFSEKNGNRDEAGHYFYREMEAKRMQKPWHIRYLEFLFIQFIFGYGVHPFRLWACWFGFVGIFAILYGVGHGIDDGASQLNGNVTPVDYIWFSIATAVTPGYAGYKPTTDFKLVAGLEAILGTFMWAAFIATFARKYMR